MYTKHQLDSTAGHKQFANRQFWTAFKLFQNILAWAVSIEHILFYCILYNTFYMQGILNDSMLSELALDRLLNRYLLLSLRANQNWLDSLTKAKQVGLQETKQLNPNVQLTYLFLCRSWLFCLTGGWGQEQWNWPSSPC